MRKALTGLSKIDVNLSRIHKRNLDVSSLRQVWLFHKVAQDSSSFAVLESVLVLMVQYGW